MQLSLYELLIHILTVTVRFLCFRFDLIFMDLETTMSFTGSVTRILILQIWGRRREHHPGAQVVETFIWAAMFGTN